MKTNSKYRIARRWIAAAFAGGLLVTPAAMSLTLPLNNGGFDDSPTGVGWATSSSYSPFGSPESHPIFFADGKGGYACELVGPGWVGFGGTAAIQQTATILQEGDYQWSFWAGQFTGMIGYDISNTFPYDFTATLHTTRGDQSFSVAIKQDINHSLSFATAAAQVTSAGMDSYGGYMVLGDTLRLYVGDVVTVSYSTSFSWSDTLPWGGIDGVVVDESPVWVRSPWGGLVYDPAAVAGGARLSSVPDGGTSAFMITVGCALLFALARRRD